MKYFISLLLSFLIAFQLFSQSSVISIEIYTDNYPEETSWVLEDENGNVIDQIFLGDLNCGSTYYNWDVYVNANNCYTFTIHDSYGDGICCNQGNGSYTISYDNNIVYSGGQFHSSEVTSNICGNVVIAGCIDPTASNYNSLADTNVVFGGVTNPFNASGSYFTGDQYLIFDAFVETRIVSAVIYAQNQCAVTFELRDNQGNTIDDTTTSVNPGGQRINFNFDVPVGFNYELGISGINPGLYRNNDQSQINYPYDFGGLISITNSSAGANLGYPGYYYFYYDLEVEAICTGINQNINGCTDQQACNFDSLATIDDGSCFYPTNSNTNIITCDSYNWNGILYTNSGLYTWTGTNINNCDSIAILDLTINNSTFSSSSVISCDSYDWNGQIITSSGSYDQLFTNSLGCDSVHTLLVTINNSTFGSSSVISCDSYDWNGQIITSSGSYDQLFTNSLGCDSVHTLLVTINNSTFGSSSVISCDSYDWNGQIITSSGSYDQLFTNSLGCDSVHTLLLTINNSNSSIITVMNDSSYTWNGVSYNSSGVYTDTLSNIYGCDSILYLNLTINDFSPSVSVVLSSTYCDSLSDLTITVSQDSGEVDMSTSLFQSDGGSFDIASMSIGDTIGAAYLMANGGLLTLNTYIMVSLIINNNQAIVVACDSLQGCLGSFTINNTPGGGVSILANTVFDGNNYTDGNMSSITFENCFVNPCGLFSFTTTINSELGETDLQVFDYTITPVDDFSPSVSVVLSSTYCDSLSDLTITVSQDSGEVDMSTSLFQSDGGSFDIASMSIGDTIGTAYLMANGSLLTLNTYIMVSLIINNNQAIVVACDSLQGCVGSFTINNTPGGGVSILANTVFDGNNYTDGNMSSITFENCFVNPCGLFSFTTTINSELGETDLQVFDYTITPVDDFSPSVSVVLSSTYCDSLSDLTITVSQDSGEVDMSTSLFQSDGGSFDIASMSIGDTIGTAYLMANGGLLTLNTYIMVSLIINNNQAIVVACDSLQGCVGSFTINTPGGGVSILANTVFDGNNYTDGNMSSITFENCFVNPCGLFSFTTTINSELGETDSQVFDYILSSLTSLNNDNLLSEKKLILVTDILGRPVSVETNKLLLYIYDDGSVVRKIILE